ncbi:hypothetical protein ILUMI_17534 [Ignelater luminosus]|uniref:Uncharacterized protein n=1 Tax=Ignelater luminosus TaxID=2038154 RepID=A0A8K0CJP6_IGNLU|nr:hypothetical protein ILUMI_17534 [Ignelater luminosus]
MPSADTPSIWPPNIRQKRYKMAPVINKKSPIWKYYEISNEGEMIALDNEPFSFFERVGFTKLMKMTVPQDKISGRTYMTQKVIPDMTEFTPKLKLFSILHATAVSVISDIFLGLVQTESARQKILLETLKVCCDKSSSTDDDSSPPSEKRNVNENGRTIEIHDSFWNYFEEIATGAGNYDK